MATDPRSTPDQAPQLAFAAALRSLAQRVRPGPAEVGEVLTAIEALPSLQLPPHRAEDVRLAVDEARRALRAYLDGGSPTLRPALLIRARNAMERAAQHSNT